jgi:hypothetical protein
MQISVQSLSALLDQIFFLSQEKKLEIQSKYESLDSEEQKQKMRIES